MEIIVTLNDQPLSSTDFYSRALVISLFTWRRSEDSDPFDDEQQGWWAEGLDSSLPAGIGSRLYLLRRRALTADTLNDAQDYATEALQWWVDQGVATDVQVSVARVGASALAMSLDVTLVSGATLKADIANLWGVIDG